MRKGYNKISEEDKNAAALIYLAFSIVLHMLCRFTSHAIERIISNSLPRATEKIHDTFTYGRDIMAVYRQVTAKGRKIARLLFTLCAILSLYFLSALPAFYQLSLSGWEATTLRILFTLLMISKYLITFCCVCYLYRDPHIVSIWKKQIEGWQ